MKLPIWFIGMNFDGKTHHLQDVTAECFETR